MAFTPMITCNACTHRCDGKSLKIYNFINDAERSETVERGVIEYVNNQTYGHLICRKTEQAGYPDLEIVEPSAPHKIVTRLEVKFQRRAFMAIEHLLPEADLQPWETIALNLSDLERYIQIYAEERIPTYLVWRVERTCLGIRFFYQDLQVLQGIYARYGNKRRLRRESGKGDVNEQGEHKGVVVNYHFSVHKEMLPFNGFLHMLLTELNVNY